MDGMLSQDEINALLSGMMDGGDTGGGDSAPAPEPEPAASMSSATPDESLLTDAEKDAVGEVANISMGTSATIFWRTTTFPFTIMRRIYSDTLKSAARAAASILS